MVSEHQLENRSISWLLSPSYNRYVFVYICICRILIRVFYDYSYSVGTVIG